MVLPADLELGSCQTTQMLIWNVTRQTKSNVVGLKQLYLSILKV